VNLLEDLPMKTALLVAVAIVIFSSLPFVSRQTDAVAEENAPAHAGSAQANQSSAMNAQARLENAQAAPNRGMRSANDEFVGKLDSKSLTTTSAQGGASVAVSLNKRVKTLAIPPAK
jgi:hypothetical protein